jgi:hypothetical protein
LVARRSHRVTGRATRARYRFEAGRRYWVDRRDLPGLSREDFET